MAIEKLVGGQKRIVNASAFVSINAAPAQRSRDKGVSPAHLRFGQAIAHGSQRSGDIFEHGSGRGVHKGLALFQQGGNRWWHRIQLRAQPERRAPCRERCPQILSRLMSFGLPQPRHKVTPVDRQSRVKRRQLTDIIAEGAMCRGEVAPQRP